MTNPFRELSECSGGTTKFKQGVCRSNLGTVAPQLVVYRETPARCADTLGNRSDAILFPHF